MKMRFFVAVVFAALLAFGLSACGGQQQGAGDAAAGEDYKTLSDIFAAETENFQSSYDAEHYVCVFAVDGKWKRAAVEMPEGLYDQIEAIDFNDPDRESKIEELLGPIELVGVDDIGEGLSDEEIERELEFE